MLRGRFGDTSGRPYLEGRLFIPRFKLRADISFLVDTGADSSLLHPADGAILGIDYSKLEGEEESVGIGGLARNYVEPAAVLFTDPGRAAYIYKIDLAIADPSIPDIDELPSLLGRDVLDNWRMVYVPLKNGLTFTVVSADLTIDLRKKRS